MTDHIANLRDFLRKIEQGDPPPPNAMAADIDTALARAIRRELARMEGRTVVVPAPIVSRFDTANIEATP